MNEKTTVLDLFSGIGGFSLGLESVGSFRTVGFCESDAYCRAILGRHWPGVRIQEDIRSFDTDGYRGCVDVITGGYPCQPFSYAGDRFGASDDRHLWPSMCGIVDSVRPRWVLCENVFGHIEMGLDDVLSDLEGIGYTVATFVLPACGVDAPHKRDRVYILANADLDEQASGGSGEVSSEGFAERLSEFDEVQRSRGPGEVWPGGGIDARRWPSEPGVARVVDGVPRRVDRNRVIGSAVVPQIVSMFGDLILSAEKEKEDGGSF